MELISYNLSDVLMNTNSNELLNGNEITGTNEIKVLQVPIRKGGYKIVNYKKNIANDETYSNLGLFRSVVFNQNNKMVSFSPPKSISFNKYKELYPTLSNVIVEEFVDGTMMNLFWDDSYPEDCVGTPDSGWHINTRKNVGCNNNYYRFSKNHTQRPFNQMFNEAFGTSGISLEDLDKTICYSFVLRHPENRIVSYVNKPELYLVEVYKLETITTDGNTFYRVVIENRSQLQTNNVFLNSSIKFPMPYLINNGYDNIVELLNNHSPDGTLTKGYVFKCPLTNKRSKVVPEEYNFVKELRGNYADMRFLYLSLRKNHRLQEYLHYYPEQYKLFDWYTTLLYDYTHFLHSMYKECYISKTKSLREYPDEIRTHMFKLHEIYINTYRGNNRSITIKDTINYINDLDVPLLFTTMFR
jgi:hypothetical protein